MRTEAEIVARIETLSEGTADFFGFQRSDLVSYLTFAKGVEIGLLKPDAPADGWKPDSVEYEAVKQQIIDYLPFAWDKANNQRGLSAGRSINHMQAWLWMLGEETAAEQISDYMYYGKPQLRAISEFVGFGWAEHDDGNWSNNEDDTGPVPESTIRIGLSTESSND